MSKTFKLVKLLDPIQVVINGGINPRGAYDGSTDYGIGDVVSYMGSSYVMYVDAPAGTLPTDATKWSILAAQGNTGATGATGAAGPAGATGATPVPGGADKQFQWNNAGVFDGAPVYWDAGNTRIGINTAAQGETLDVKGNFQVKDADTATKEYRFRTSGGNLDVDFSGADGFISVFSAANYGGTQRNKLRLEAGADITHAIGQWQFASGPFSGAQHVIDGNGGIQFFGGTPAGQEAAIADSTGTATDNQRAINALLASMRVYGLIAP